MMFSEKRLLLFRITLEAAPCPAASPGQVSEETTKRPTQLFAQARHDSPMRLGARRVASTTD
jgi:hypothetical protein